MADQASSSTTIDAAPDVVLGVIRDLPAYPDWTGELTRVVVDEQGPDGPVRATFTLGASGMNDEYTLLYDWQPDGVSWSLAAPTKLQKSQKGSYRLAPRGAGTDVTYLLTVESRVPMIGLMKRKFEKMIMDSALKNLKKRAESLASGQSADNG